MAEPIPRGEQSAVQPAEQPATGSDAHQQQEQQGQQEQPGQQGQHEHQVLDDAVRVFCCQRCRCVLFTEAQLSSQHEEGRHSFSYRNLAKDAAQNATTTAVGIASPPGCSSLFLSEPNEWMSALAMAEEVEGKLCCPKCAHRVGSFSWSGSQCSCGTWIVPAIQVPASKVDPRMLRPEDVPAHARDRRAPPPPADPAAGRSAPAQAAQKPHGDPREALHEQWLRLTDAGDVDALMAMVDHAECSMTTVQGKAFDGPEAMARVLRASSAKLKGRLRLGEGLAVAALPAPSRASRAIFAVEGVEDAVGESISWSGPGADAKVQHVMRVKAPSDMYLKGHR